MIQIEGHDNTNTSTRYFYINLRDRYETYNFDNNYMPLFSITSQETGKAMNFIPLNMNKTNAQRYVRFGIVIAHTNELPVIGIINIGNKNYPYGLYDVVAYNNVSYSNTDPALAQSPIWNGLLNLEEQADNESIQFEEYEETQNQQVYITNEYQNLPD